MKYVINLQMKDLIKNDNYGINHMEMGVIVAHVFWIGRKYWAISMADAGMYHYREFFLSFFQCSKELGFLDKIKDIEWFFDNTDWYVNGKNHNGYKKVFPDALEDFMKRQKK